MVQLGFSAMDFINARVLWLMCMFLAGSVEEGKNVGDRETLIMSL